MTSLQQCRDVFEYNDSLLDEETVRWVTDEVLICTNELVHARLLSDAIEILRILVAANERIQVLLNREVYECIQRRHATVLRLMADRRPSTSSELTLDNAIQTIPRPPSSLGSSAKDPTELQNFGMTATELPNLVLYTPTERQQANTAANRPAKNQYKPEKTPLAKSRRKSLLRLSELPLRSKRK